MRLEVSYLLSKGQMPSSKSGVERVKEWQDAFEKITPPVSDEEAKALAGLFPQSDDDCFGLAWSLVHLVETSPNWPIQECLQDTGKPWVARLRQRF